MLRQIEERLLYEDNHLMVVNKEAGEIVQGDKTGDRAMPDEIKDFIARRDSKPGNVFLGVTHRLDRPTSGAVVFAKTSKALSRMNELFRKGEVDKTYWAITEKAPPKKEDTLKNWLFRDRKKNRSFCWNEPGEGRQEARLRYKLLASSDRYHLVEVELLTGRHHQIRCQLSALGCPIKGDLKYGAKRSNRGGGISLHARRIAFVHPVKKEELNLTAPVPPEDALWRHFEESCGEGV
ncbi:MAG: RNA pseudouridine synthase [Spirochaetales bacterium]|nr:RNA pseudouridine synthase [Spirochaetales bacterium]